MAKRRYAIDEAKIARFIKEGRGLGCSADYKPWLTIQDISSLGRSTRIYGKKTKRQHHLFSDLETGLFLLLDWDERVVDLREQFPLDRKVTQMLAAKMGIVHPRDMSTQTDIVMTTDMLVDVHNESGSSQIAFSVKPSSKLEDKRTLEKLELERRYWERSGIPWRLVTEHELPVVRVANLRWLHEMHSLDGQQSAHENYWHDLCVRFLSELANFRTGLVHDFFIYLQNECGFADGEPMTALRHLAATKRITIDLDRQFSTKSNIDVLGVRSGEVAQRRVA